MAKRILLSVSLVFGLLLPVSAFAENPIKIAFAYDVGGRGDGGSDDAVALGIDAAKKKFKLTSFDIREVVTDGSSKDRLLKIRFLAKANYTLIVGVGAAYAPALNIVSEEYPATSFAIIDDQSVAHLNVANIAFNQRQAAYLAGVFAASASKSKRIGLITDAHDIYDPQFLALFTRGAKSVYSKIFVDSRNPMLTPQVDVTGLVTNGVDVIYSLWNSSPEVLNAVAAVSTVKKPIRLIGVDPNQYFLRGIKAKSVLLGTIKKRFDKAVFTLIAGELQKISPSDSLNESLGIYGHEYSIQDGGLEISYALLGATYSSRIAVAKIAITSGKVKI